MLDVDAIIDRVARAPGQLSAPEMEALLGLDDEQSWRKIFAAARALKQRIGRGETLPRGLIETGNICVKNCRYCGIARGVADVPRYHLSVEETLACVQTALQRRYPAVAFQSGELESEANTVFYEQVLERLPPNLEVTLSLGEQTEDVYRRWKIAAGGRTLRYLLRIETSDRELYGRLHPAECSFERRLNCIRTLKKLGYVTGSGVLIGVPRQSLSQLANDLKFFHDEHLDMVGMGPYIPAPGTPLAAEISPTNAIPSAATRVQLTLRMIALARLTLHHVNLVSATALEVLGGDGARQAGLDAGANVIMPNLTPELHRADYALYPGKWK